MNAIASWIAWALPRRVVYWCGIRIAAHATQGKHASQVMPDLLMMDALHRWDERAPSEEGGAKT